MQRQAGHSDAHTTLNIYAQVIDTDFGAKERLEWLCEYNAEDDETDRLMEPTDPGTNPITSGREG